MQKPIQIISGQNEQVKKWKKLLSKKGRAETGLFLIEGEHLIEEAVKSNTEIEALLFIGEQPDHWKQIQSKKYILTRSHFEQLSQTESPQGVAAVVRQPHWDLDQLLREERAFDTFLLLDGIQDPGNLGTLFRTSLATGVTGVILGKGTVDRFNSKVVRASLGATFRLPIIHMDLTKAIDSLLGQGVEIIHTSPHAGDLHFSVTYSTKTAFLLGNEANGVAPEIAQLAERSVKLPMLGDPESLNVSITGAVLLYERLRQRMICD